MICFITEVTVLMVYWTLSYSSIYLCFHHVCKQGGQKSRNTSQCDVVIRFNTTFNCDLSNKHSFIYTVQTKSTQTEHYKVHENRIQWC